MNARDVIAKALAPDEAWRHVPVGQLPGDPRPRAAENADVILDALDSAGLVILARAQIEGAADDCDNGEGYTVATDLRAMISAKDRG